MHPEYRRAYDLTRVIERIDPQRYPSFAKAVRAFHAACSVELDLFSVLHSLEELNALDKSSLSPRNSRLGQALMVHAVVTYSRATHSKAVNRYNVGVVAGYDKELREYHDEIITLRDKCLAHFGPGDDLWHDERVVCMETNQGNGVTMAHRRTNYKQNTIEMLNELVRTALPHLKKLQAERADELNRELMQVSQELSEVIDDEPFDPEDFFDTELEAYKRFWADNGFFEIYSSWEEKG